MCKVYPVPVQCGAGLLPEVLTVPRPGPQPPDTQRPHQPARLQVPLRQRLLQPHREGLQETPEPIHREDLQELRSTRPKHWEDVSFNKEIRYTD